VDRLSALIRCAVVCSLLLTLSTPLQAAPDPMPGKWEMIVQTEMSNMPMKMPTMIFSYCLKPEEAKDL
jgi:hypothetical protein